MMPISQFKNKFKKRDYDTVRKEVGEKFFALGRLQWSKHVAEAEVSKLDKEIEIVNKQIQNLSIEAEKSKPIEGESTDAS